MRINRILYDVQLHWKSSLLSIHIVNFSHIGNTSKLIDTVKIVFEFHSTRLEKKLEVI